MEKKVKRQIKFIDCLGSLLVKNAKNKIYDTFIGLLLYPDIHAVMANTVSFGHLKWLYRLKKAPYILKTLRKQSKPQVKRYEELLANDCVFEITKYVRGG